MGGGGRGGGGSPVNNVICAWKSQDQLIYWKDIIQDINQGYCHQQSQYNTFLFHLGDLVYLKEWPVMLSLYTGRDRLLSDCSEIQ